MPKNPDLLQKTYYLHKEIDKDLINFIANSRNVSELIRNAIIREIRIQQGEIALIDIKNRQIIGEISLPSPAPSVITDNNNHESNIEVKQTKVDEELVANKDDIAAFLSTCSFISNT